MKKLVLSLISLCVAALPLRAVLLFQDSTNYPYTNGCIEGQGQWFSYSPLSNPGLDAFVTNNTLLMVTQSTNDAVATPTNGWNNSESFTFASFQLNVGQLPTSTNGGYFCEFQDLNATNHLCHVFVDTRFTSVPGTYRLGIANDDSSFNSGTTPPPVNFPMDLAPGVNYTVVIQWDTNSSSDNSLAGAFLWINPSEQDFVNADNFAPEGDGFVFGNDTFTTPSLLSIKISQIGFSPYITAGISNVIAATTFDEVNTTNLPVFGIQPQSQTNYSGNPTAFYAVASAVDATYQWYSSAGPLTDDGVNIIGSTNVTLTLNNLSATDYYYAIVTDAYGNHATSAYATNTVITTPTAPFFTNNTPANLTNNLFTDTGFTNLAFGTGPLIYQWYFAPTNTPNTYSPLSGQTNPTIYLSLVDFTYSGNYFLIVSNAVGGGSLTVSPTNTLTELPPLNATILQLHNLLLASSNLLTQYERSSYYINSNNVIVSGYVTSFKSTGSSGYTQYYIQDASGYGIQVFINGVGNTNTPPIGTYVVATGPIEVFDTGLEVAPNGVAAVVATNAPVVPLTPVLANGFFNDLSTNVLGSNALLHSCSVLTFTNVYLYADKTGDPITNNTTFPSGYDFNLYMTVGQYHYPDNTNTIEVFQSCYKIGTNASTFTGRPVPTNCYQLTGAYLGFGGTPEIEPTRLADYVLTPPPPVTATITQSNHVPTVTWGPVQAGSTYSVNAATNLTGSWTLPAYGLGYYPANGTFTDTNLAPAKFYLITSP